MLTIGVALRLAAIVASRIRASRIRASRASRISSEVWCLCFPYYQHNSGIYAYSVDIWGMKISPHKTIYLFTVEGWSENYS